jgi:hypothetical protein
MVAVPSGRNVQTHFLLLWELVLQAALPGQHPPTLLCKKILTWKTDLHRSCTIHQPWTFDLAFTMWEDALSCGLVKVQEIRESEVCAEGEGYSKVEGSAEENPGLSK